MRKINSKGQLTLGDAPTVVLMVGLVFLVMATIAMVSDKFGTAMLVDSTRTVNNESLTITGTGNALVSTRNILGFTNFNATKIMNCTTCALPTNNTLVEGVDYVLNSNGSIQNLTFVGTPLKATYVFTYNNETVAYNTTGDLNTEIANNTSIAGIILTISLVGIVLSVLIGVFVGVRRGSRV